MCNCINDIETRFTKHFKEELEPLGNAHDVEANFENKMIILGDKGYPLGIPITKSWKHTAKNGNISTKKKKVFINVDFCLFCGEKQE